jgi:putative nucleotidyltransferase with HDIG domain
MGENVREKVLKAALRARFLPSPITFDRVALNFFSNPGMTFNDLCTLLECDCAIHLKILSIANNPFYSNGSEIFSFLTAARLIGYEDLRNIVFSLLLQNSAHPLPFQNKELLISIFKHSLYVAVAAEVFAKRTLVEDPSKAFSVALVHDIGKLLLLTILKEYGEIVEEAEITGQDLSVLERERLGVDHSEVGGLLARRWGLPSLFVHVISEHHKRPDNHGLPGIIYSCDRFSLSQEDLGHFGFILRGAREEVEREYDRKLTPLQFLLTATEIVDK